MMSTTSASRDSSGQLRTKTMCLRSSDVISLVSISHSMALVLLFMPFMFSIKDSRLSKSCVTRKPLACWSCPPAFSCPATLQIGLSVRQRRLQTIPSESRFPLRLSTAVRWACCFHGDQSCHIWLSGASVYAPPGSPASHVYTVMVKSRCVCESIHKPCQSASSRHHPWLTTVAGCTYDVNICA